jgi:hypothetical protein
MKNRRSLLRLISVKLNISPVIGVSKLSFGLVPAVSGGFMRAANEKRLKNTVLAGAICSLSNFLFSTTVIAGPTIYDPLPPDALVVRSTGQEPSNDLRLDPIFPGLHLGGSLDLTPPPSAEPTPIEVDILNWRTVRVGTTESDKTELSLIAEFGKTAADQTTADRKISLTILGEAWIRDVTSLPRSEYFTAQILQDSVAAFSYHTDDLPVEPVPFEFRAASSPYGLRSDGLYLLEGHLILTPVFQSPFDGPPKEKAVALRATLPLPSLEATITPTPEPSALGIFAAALLVVFTFRIRNRE